METTRTMAGLVAHAGAARLRTGAPYGSGRLAAAPARAPRAGVRHVVAADHQITVWTEGRFGKPAASMALDDRKNTLARPLLERSP